MNNINECPECGSKSLTWDNKVTTYSGVQEGRLRTNEMTCVFFLGCDSCSATLEIVNADKVAVWLTESRNEASAANAEPILVQAVAVTRDAGEDGLELDWLLEGGIAEMEFAGQVLFAMHEANDLCDEDGSAYVYRTPPAEVTSTIGVELMSSVGNDEALGVMAKSLGSIREQSVSPDAVRVIQDSAIDCGLTGTGIMELQVKHVDSGSVLYPPTHASYVTQPGESLAGIAARELGDARRWAEIRDYNAKAFPGMQHHDYYPVGTTIRLPIKKEPGNDQ